MLGVFKAHVYRPYPQQRPRNLGPKAERDCFHRLNLDDQRVRMQLVKWSVPKQLKRRTFELDGDLRVALRQPLARPQIERHSRPAPIIDVELQGHERLTARFRRDPWFRPISRYFFLTQQSRAILAAHAAPQNVVRAQRLNRMQNLSLLITYCVRLKRYRRFHRG